MILRVDGLLDEGLVDPRTAYLDVVFVLDQVVLARSDTVVTTC